ncbi:MAG: cysteine desulfurase [Kofleriaceae bacterium]
MDLAARRREFPALAATSDAGPAFDGAPASRFAYLDSAATTLIPRVVLDATTHALTSLGNPGRGAYARAQAATDAVAEVRDIVAGALVGWRGSVWAAPPARSTTASSGTRHVAAEDIVFTSGTTASVNLVAETWGRQHVGAGDVVIASEAEHHSNFLPWQRLCERTGATLELARVDDRGRFDLDAFRAQVTRHGSRVKLVAIAHVSNVLGTIAPIADIGAIAAEADARVFVDGAQAIAHLDVDVAELGCDFYAFSGHKVYGPPGAGVLWAASGLLEGMGPWQLGGGMVSTVELARSTWRAAPARFEAGTPNTPAIAGLGAALVWARTTYLASRVADGEHALRGVASSMRDHEAQVHRALRDVIRDAGARILGAPEVGVVSFAWDYHPHDIATIADREGVALRSGHHCAQLIHKRFGVDASTRASVAMYSGLDDVEQLGRALARVREVLGPR